MTAVALIETAKRQKLEEQQAEKNAEVVNFQTLESFTQPSLQPIEQIVADLQTHTDWSVKEVDKPTEHNLKSVTVNYAYAKEEATQQALQFSAAEAKYREYNSSFGWWNINAFARQWNITSSDGHPVGSIFVVPIADATTHFAGVVYLTRKMVDRYSGPHGKVQDKIIQVEPKQEDFTHVLAELQSIIGEWVYSDTLRKQGIKI